MKVERILKNTLIEQFNRGKAIVLVGPRQVGKSTLINEILKNKDFLFTLWKLTIIKCNFSMCKTCKFTL